MAAAAALLALSLGGCSSIDTFKQTWDVAKAAVVSKDGVVLAVSAFHAAEVTATVYNEQKKCPRGASRPTCRTPAITEMLAVAMTEGQKARDGLLDFAEGHPGAIGDQGLYDALKASTATLKSIFNAYQIGAVL
jgi:hypothetical protein